MRNISFRLRFFAPCLSIVALLATGQISFGDDGAGADNPDAVDFNQHIRPIFTHHCTACHGSVKQAADLSFVYAEAAMDTYNQKKHSPDTEKCLSYIKFLRNDIYGSS